MSSGSSNETGRYREKLPPGCPPKAAEEIIDLKICYRLVQNAPPQEDDFRSQRALQPNRDFRLLECQVRGLSVFMKSTDAARAARHSRNLRNMQVSRLTLTQGAGYIQQTGTGNRSHYTWWPYREFDVLANCEVMQ